MAPVSSRPSQGVSHAPTDSSPCKAAPGHRSCHHSVPYQPGSLAFAFQGYPGDEGLEGPQGPQGPYVSISVEVRGRWLLPVWPLWVPLVTQLCRQAKLCKSIAVSRCFAHPSHLAISQITCQLCGCSQADHTICFLMF